MKNLLILFIFIMGSAQIAFGADDFIEALKQADEIAKVKKSDKLIQAISCISNDISCPRSLIKRLEFYFLVVDLGNDSLTNNEELSPEDRAVIIDLLQKAERFNNVTNILLKE